MLIEYIESLSAEPGHVATTWKKEESNFVLNSFESEPGCPVPGLTLLSFGPTEDIPEATKMVTAGTACLVLL